MRSVLLVSPWAHRPGHYWINTSNLAAALAGCGLRVSVLTLFEPLGVVRLPPNVRHYVVLGPKCRLLRGLLGKTGCLNGLLQQAACLAFAARKGLLRGADLIHFTDASPLLATAFALCRRRAVMCTLLGPPEAGPGWARSVIGRTIKTILQRGAAAVVALTGRVGFVCETEEIRAQWAKLFREHVHVVPYAICTPQVKPDRWEARLRLGLSTSAPVFLLFGTQRPSKDYETVLQAAVRCSSEPILLFVGKYISGPMPGEIAKHVGCKHVRIVDEFVPEEQLPLYFAAADATILPYSGPYDKGSGVLLLACKWQVPVIATDTAYFRRFFQLYPVGHLYPSGDIERLATIMDLFADPAHATTFHSALTRAATAHSWQAALPRYLSLYELYLPAAHEATQTS